MFLQAIGGTATSLSLSSHHWLGGLALAQPAGQAKKPAIVRAAFLYPPTESLRKAGYYSWPGSTFDAEGRQSQYIARLQAIQARLGIRVWTEQKPLDEEATVAQFINAVKAEPPDALFLVPLKKGHWPHVTRIVKETGLPTVVLGPLGVLLAMQVRELHRQSGVYMINSLDNFDAVEQGLRMVRTASWMRQSCILNIARKSGEDRMVPHLGTKIRTVANTEYIDEFKRTGATDEVKELAARYRTGATKVLQPSDEDIFDAARASVALRRVVEAAKVDAVMMDCLPGLQHPHQHVPPCMGFMDSRDRGVPAGCESDLDATLTMMLMQYLFDKPGFQHNPTVETERNHYFCAHCTSATRMKGADAPPEPYVLMNHAEAGWGCVPRVLFSPGQDVTITKYLSATADSEKAQMLVYSGQIVGCPSVPQAGGCRTNAETTINELQDVTELKGHHLVMVYGNYARVLHRFCQMYGIETTV
ncbi:MAG: hypothetical protein EHM35_10310 [Planctomycetaceae bacterium]|nr:MAG: hypothetical protein EHM35_10310 [Planctomycetaceae bacterium]